MEFRSTNPVFSRVSKSREASYPYVTGKTATFSGIAVKTGFYSQLLLEFLHIYGLIYKH